MVLIRRIRKKNLNWNFKFVKSLFNRRNLYIIISFILIIFSIIYYFAIFTDRYKNTFALSDSNYMFTAYDDKYRVNIGIQHDPKEHLVRYESVPDSSIKLAFINEVEVKENLEERNRIEKITDWIKQKTNTQSKSGIELRLLSQEIEDTGLTDNALGSKTIEEVLSENGLSEFLTENLFNERIMYQGDKPVLENNVVYYRNAFPGVDLKYEIIKHKGVQESIIISKLDSMRPGCETLKSGCKLPKNKFIFSLKYDENVELKSSIGTAQPIWYLVDEYERYISHFTPLFAYDSKNQKTNNVDFKINHDTLEIIMDLAWMMDPAREYPITIQ